MPEPEPTGTSRRRWVIVWSVAGVAVLAAVAAIVLLRPGSTSTNATASASPSAAATTAEADATPSRTAAPVTGPVVTPSRVSTSKKTGDNVPKQQLEPVGINTPVEGEDGIRVALTRIEAVQGEAAQPGEVAGPAIRVTVTITNASKHAFSVSASAVNAYYGSDRIPANTLVKPGGVPLYGKLAPGESTYGVYLFRIPTSDRGDVTITVDYQAAAPTVVFRGSVA